MGNGVKIDIDKSTKLSIKREGGKVHLRFDGMMYGWVRMTPAKADQVIAAIKTAATPDAIQVETQETEIGPKTIIIKDGEPIGAQG